MLKKTLICNLWRPYSRYSSNGPCQEASVSVTFSRPPGSWYLQALPCTVQAQTASLVFKHKGGKYLLNLIDTPGHVDFSYEVSRSLAAVSGAVLLVDAAQGIQVCQNNY